MADVLAATTVDSCVPAYLDVAARQTAAELVTVLDRVRQDRAYGAYVADYPSRPSKGLRPALAMASAEAHGGAADAVRPFSVALELMHNAFLVHDDVEDGSLTRRGSDALHVRYGTPAAVHAGDSLLALSLRCLEPLDPLIGVQRAAAIRALFSDTLITTIEGQGLEFASYRQKLGAANATDYIDIIVNKTGAYTVELPVMGGALLASWRNGTSPRWQELLRYCRLVGILFQLVDDVRNFSATISGKDRNDDLVEGKLTLVLLLAYRDGNAKLRREMSEFFEAPQSDRTIDLCEHMREQILTTDAIAECRSFVWSLARSATELAEFAFEESGRSDGSGFLLSLPEWLAQSVS